MNQIYFNLFSNAVKYTPENGTVQVHLSSTKKSDTDLDFVFEVSDNGIGMENGQLLSGSAAVAGSSLLS